MLLQSKLCEIVMAVIDHAYLYIFIHECNLQAHTLYSFFFVFNNDGFDGEWRYRSCWRSFDAN